MIALVKAGRPCHVRLHTAPVTRERPSRTSAGSKSYLQAIAQDNQPGPQPRKPVQLQQLRFDDDKESLHDEKARAIGGNDDGGPGEPMTDMGSGLRSPSADETSVHVIEKTTCIGPWTVANAADQSGTSSFVP